MDQYGGSSFTRGTLSADGSSCHAPTDCAVPYLYYCAARLLSFRVEASLERRILSAPRL
jgi:hypothetical protein